LSRVHSAHSKADCARPTCAPGSVLFETPHFIVPFLFFCLFAMHSVNTRIVNPVHPKIRERGAAYLVSWWLRLTCARRCPFVCSRDRLDPPPRLPLPVRGVVMSSEAPVSGEAIYKDVGLIRKQFERCGSCRWKSRRRGRTSTGLSALWSSRTIRTISHRTRAEC
jgi:hypothetical protein